MEQNLFQSSVAIHQSHEINIYSGNLPNIAMEDYRAAIIKLNTLTFGVPHYCYLDFTVLYHKSKNFNVTLPNVGGRFPVIADKIWPLREKKTEGYVELATEEKRLVAMLPNGWNEIFFYQYRNGGKQFKNVRPMQRTQWLLPLRDIRERIPIHPTLLRALSLEELKLCAETPQAMIAWLKKQAEHYINDDWEGDDWQSRYDHIQDCWVGENTNGALEKTFDLRTFYCRSFSPEYYTYIPNARFI